MYAIMNTGQADPPVSRFTAARVDMHWAAKAKKTPSKTRAPAGSPHSKLSIKELEKRIARTERRIREIDESMMDPTVYTNGKKTRKLQAERESLAGELEPLEFEWSCRADDQ